MSVFRGAVDLAELFGTTLQSELIHSCCCRALPVPLPFSPAQPCFCCCCCHPQQDLGATGVLVRNITGIEFAKQVLYIFFPHKAGKTIRNVCCWGGTEQSSTYSFGVEVLYCSLCWPTLGWWQRDLQSARRAVVSSSVCMLGDWFSLRRCYEGDSTTKTTPSPKLWVCFTHSCTVQRTDHQLLFST